MAFPMRLPARWLTSAMARLTFMSGVGYVAAAYTVSRFLTRSRRRPLKSSPADIGLKHQDLTIEAADGVKLAGWLVEPENARGTVALFHGMRHNRESLLARIAFLHAAGYRCLAIDHRAHGASAGKRVSFGWYEARDVQAVAGWIESHYPDQPRFALGISMGAVAMCFAGPECGWKAIVLEGCYCDLNTAFRRRIGHYYPAWFGQLFPAIIWITQRRLRVRVSQIRPIDAVGRFAKTPMLVVTGELDVLSPPSDGLELQAAANGEFVLIANAGHSDVCEKGGAVYRERITGFLKQGSEDKAG